MNNYFPHVPADEALMKSAADVNELKDAFGYNGYPRPLSTASYGEGEKNSLAGLLETAAARCGEPFDAQKVVLAFLDSVGSIYKKSVAEPKGGE